MLLKGPWGWSIMYFVPGELALPSGQIQVPAPKEGKQALKHLR
jgi:hypothetical protein